MSKDQNGQARIKRVALLGTYSPRLCGIGTFTADLCESLTSEFGPDQFIVVALNDQEEGYDYPEEVRFEIDESDVGAYLRAADFLNVGNVDVVCLQHEYGIFGGKAGSYALTLLRELRMPVVTTLHTVLEHPNDAQRRVLDEVLKRSERVNVMNHHASGLLQKIHGLSADKIDVIHHGIPETEFKNPDDLKEEVGLAGKKVLLTFGLLSPNKGIEYAIRALPKVLQKVPNAVYAVVGATHPHVKETDGESYRISLQHLAEKLGVSGSVVFHDRFVSKQELMSFIGAADVYVTPYMNEDQISSGTLAYAYGTGTAVISTPYWCARELLAEDRGVLVPPKDSEALAEAAIKLLKNDADRNAMRKRAFEAGREMTWPRVAKEYMEAFIRAQQESLARKTLGFHLKSVQERPLDLPSLRLGHLRRLTDETGLLQHAVYDIPNYDEGYCLDDNARALLLMTQLDHLGLLKGPRMHELASRYLAFVWHAYNALLGRFRNFLSYDRHWLEKIGSEDSHGRTLWALGTVINRSTSTTYPIVARRLFDGALPAVKSFSSPRAWAFSLLGLEEYLKRFPTDEAPAEMREELVDRLLRAYEGASERDWKWFENIVAYSNAKLPHALIVAGHSIGRSDAVKAGLEALKWLTKVQRSESGNFSPVGTNGHFRRGCECARFDQQPVEAYATVSASLGAYRVTGDPKWLIESERAFEWFLGQNDVGVPLYDPQMGGCRDGLHPDGVNENMGAESTLAFLLSLVEMQMAQDVLQTPGVEIEARAALR